MPSRILNQLKRYENKTEIDGWTAILTLSVIEYILLPISIFFLVVVIYANEMTRHYHINMRRIISFYLFICIGRNLMRILQLTYVFMYSSDADFASTPFYSTVSQIHLFTMCAALFSNPGVVAERFVATKLISNYEKTSRHHVHLIIMAFIILLASGMAYFYIRGIPSLAVFVFFSLVNLISILLNRKLYKRNVKFYDASLYTRQYSLQYRFQISENLKATKLWTEVEAVIGLSNLLYLVCLTVDIFEAEGMWTNISETFFNYCEILYNFAIPFIILKHTNTWKRFLRSRRVKPAIVEANQVSNIQKVGIVDTLGRHLETVDKAEDYYNRLRNQWESNAPQAGGRSAELSKF